MGYKRTDAAWTPAKMERFRKLVLKHVSSGGTVGDACQQFEFETDGIHKTRANHVKWMLTVRYTCKEEYKRAVQLGLKAKLLKFKDLDKQYEEVPPMQTIKDDEIAQKLYQAVEAMTEDRRQMAVSLQAYENQAEYSEKRIQDLEEEKKLSEIRFEKKDKEIEKLNRELVEKQFKHDQLVEDYQQLRTNNAKEQDRFQNQLKEIQSKYESLMADYSRFRSNTASEIERLERSLREEQVRNTQLAAQYEQSRLENASLTKRITDFAQQISSVLSIDETPTTNVSPIPIRPVVAQDSTGTSGV